MIVSVFFVLVIWRGLVVFSRYAILSHFWFSFLCSCREREEKKAKRKKGSGMLSFNMDEEDEENGEECKY